MEDCKETKSWICYTDGSKLGESTTDGGPGAWAFHAIFGESIVEKSCGYFKTTNNRMEILAIISFLEEFQEPTKVTIRSDSQYTIDAVINLLILLAENLFFLAMCQLSVPWITGSFSLFRSSFIAK